MKNNLTFAKNKFLIFTLVLIQFAIWPLKTNAQAGGDDLEMLVSDTKNDLMTVVGGGLAGAVLGLSTLSFVEEPKDHTKNIIVGASLGIILGVGYVAFSQASKTQEMMYGAEEQMGASLYNHNPKNFNTASRSSWHYEELAKFTSTKLTPYQLNYSVKF